ncbi:hypothetical protein [Priestia megaterium]|uniref:hypothetical protein n=1 Tax=Priestia megaterium TaxID=1404 RepID=UPI0031FBD213
MKIQLSECLEIISLSLDTVKDNKAFNKVLAGQLRVLLCDTKFGVENSLINKVISNPLLDCTTNNFVSYNNTRLIEFIQPESLFKKNESQLSLETWLSQKVIKSNIFYESLENCTCVYCRRFEGEHEVIIRDFATREGEKCFITMMCAFCGASFEVELNDIANAYEGKVENVKKTTITIKDIIKNYANKNGGTHVDSVLDIKGFLIAEIGDRYIQAISQYMLEYFSEIEMS